jgi:hypothetical protein
MPWILCTGLMGSGKSTIIREYIANFKTIAFTPPKIEATHQGLEFEFIDNVFGIMQEKGEFVSHYYFYELDAPTIKKWVQFVKIADSIIVVYNDQPIREYNPPKYLMETLLNHKKKEAKFIFVINNYSDFNIAKSNLIEKYNLDRLDPSAFVIKDLPRGSSSLIDITVPKISLDIEKVGDIINWTIDNIGNN